MQLGISDVKVDASGISKELICNDEHHPLNRNHIQPIKAVCSLLITRVILIPTWNNNGHLPGKICCIIIIIIIIIFIMMFIYNCVIIN